MKTGLLTFYHIHHYGAVLQAAALQEAVECLGASCEIIDYYVNQNNALFRRPGSLTAAASDLHTALHYAPLRRRYDRFQAFAQERLTLTPRRYQARADLGTLSYDLLLCGSDQIWNPLIFPDRRFDPAFFGAFSDARKAAYAPSFGLSRLPEGMEAELRESLAAFSHLSARERAGQALIRDIDGREVPVVLDPTLLLTAERWSALARRPEGLPQGPYVLCYFISDPAPLLPYLRAVAGDLPVVQLCGVRRKAVPQARAILDAGPAEFLALFRDAAAVVTNSFHGTAFAVQFQKPFFAAVSPGERDDPEHARVRELLDRLGLSDRVTGTGRTAAPDAPVDWAAASAALEAARTASLSYLRAALTDAPEKAERKPPEPGKTALPRLASHERCTGCTACASVCPQRAIAMVRDQEGFLYPRIDSAACVRCGRCTAVCPALRERETHCPPAAFAAWNREEAVRTASSSGGAFTALAEYLLEEGGVVFGAALDARQRVVHAACFQREDLWRLRGSKYVQSDLGETFHQVKRALRTRRVLFTGTPCQVDGLYAYLGGRPERLITCDLLCHGVPSPGVWEDWTETLRRERGTDLQSVRFRDKSSGWERFSLTLTYGDGSVDAHPFYETEFGRAYGRNLLSRPCCYRCPYASLNRPGDFSLGDFWGAPDLPERSRGVSLLLVNTTRASHIFDQIPLERRPCPLDQAVAGNPCLDRPAPRSPERAAFFAAYALEPFDAVRRRFLALPPLPVRAAKKAVRAVRKRKS